MEGELPPPPQITFDLLMSVAERTFLSPYFTFWMPVMVYCQGIPTWHSAFTSTFYLFVFTLIRAILIGTSSTWRNRSWKGGISELLGKRRIRWDDQIVLVTGGSDGLGRVLVETLAVKHVTLVVLDVKEYSTETDVCFYKCDVSDPLQVAQVAAKIREDVGNPTIIINNAGIVNGKLIVDLDNQDIQKTFGVNIMSHFYILKEFLPAIIEAKTGHIVSISSVLGTVGAAQASDYCASKAAVINLHESLRSELDFRHKVPDVRTTLVGPGTLATKMFAKMTPQNQFWFPAVSPHELTKDIIQALDSHESREIWRPYYANFTWLLRGTTSWIRDGSHWLTGADHALVHFNDNQKGSQIAKSSAYDLK